MAAYEALHMIRATVEILHDVEPAELAESVP
jgi:hypothetical protein